MVSNNRTSSNDDYVIISGPNGTGPNVYKIATVLLLFVAVVCLTAIQLCKRKHLKAFWRWFTCKKPTEEEKNTHAKKPKNISFVSTTWQSSGKREVPDNEETESQRMLSSIVSQNKDQQVNGMARKTIMKKSDYKNGSVLKEDFGSDGFSNVPAVIAGQIHAETHVNNHGNEAVGESEESRLEIDALNSSRHQRRRRSGVCLSMLEGKSLPEPLAERSSYGLMEQVEVLPQLQVNGVECEVDDQCSEASPKGENKDEDLTDEGQIQCAIKYEKESNILLVYSVKVKTKVEPGVPGFFVEVTLLPKQTISAKSRVYVTANSEVDVVLKETFELSCLQPDLEQNSLFLAVKPMYSETVLYAETDLKELALDSEREIMLGGYLKCLSTHYDLA